MALGLGKAGNIEGNLGGSPTGLTPASPPPNQVALTAPSKVGAIGGGSEVSSTPASQPLPYIGTEREALLAQEYEKTKNEEKILKERIKELGIDYEEFKKKSEEVAAMDDANLAALKKPDVPIVDKSTFTTFMPLLILAAVMGTKNGPNHGLTALKAFTAGLKGYQEGREKYAKEKMTEFQDSYNKMKEANQVRSARAQQIIDDKFKTLGQKQQELQYLGVEKRDLNDQINIIRAADAHQKELDVQYKQWEKEFEAREKKTKFDQTVSLISLKNQAAMLKESAALKNLQIDEATAKKEEAKRVKENDASTSMTLLDSATGLVNDILGDEDAFRYATGWSYGLSKFPASRAMTVAGKIEQLKNSLAVDKLSVLKGPTSDKDLAFVTNIVSNLNPKMSEEDLTKELVKLSGYIEKIKTQTEKRYSDVGLKRQTAPIIPKWAGGTAAPAPATGKPVAAPVTGKPRADQFDK